jgi:ribosomal protein L37AE/L43A
VKKCPVCISCLKQVLLESSGLMYWYCELCNQVYQHTLNTKLELEEDKLVISTVKSMFGGRIE